MNVFNRVVMCILILVSLAAAVFLFATHVYGLEIIGNYVGTLRTALYDSPMTFYGFLIATGLWAVLMIILFILEVRRPRRKFVRIRTKSGGKAQLGIESVAQSLEYRIDELAGVRKVHPRIISHGRDVEVVVDLDTSPSVNVPVLTDQVVDLCHSIVEEQLGVKIRGKVVVNVRHEPYPRGTMPPTGPLGEAAIATTPTLTQPRSRPAAARTAPAPAPEPVTVAPEEPTQAPSGSEEEGVAPSTEDEEK